MQDEDQADASSEVSRDLLDSDLCRMVASLRDVALSIGFRVLYVKLVRCTPKEITSSPTPKLPRNKGRRHKKMAALIYTASNAFGSKGYTLSTVDLQQEDNPKDVKSEKWEMQVDLLDSEEAT